MTARGKNYCTSVMQGDMTIYSNTCATGSHHTVYKAQQTSTKDRHPAKVSSFVAWTYQSPYTTPIQDIILIILPYIICIKSLLCLKYKDKHIYDYKQFVNYISFSSPYFKVKYDRVNSQKQPLRTLHLCSFHQKPALKSARRFLLTWCHQGKLHFVFVLENNSR